MGIQWRRTFLFTQAGPGGVPNKNLCIKNYDFQILSMILCLFPRNILMSGILWDTLYPLSHQLSGISSSWIPELNTLAPSSPLSISSSQILISYPSCKDLREEVKHWLEAFKSRPGYNLQRPRGFDLKLTIGYHQLYNLQRVLEACDFRLDED